MFCDKLSFVYLYLDIKRSRKFEKRSRKGQSKFSYQNFLLSSFFPTVEKTKQFFSISDLELFFSDFNADSIFSVSRFCVGDKFYLCDNKILCEYDYEERLVFASMANHPILKRHASGSLPGTPPNIPNIPTSNSSPIQQNGHHHGMLSNISSPRSQNNDLNNNQNGLNGVSSPFGTPTHMKQVISTN